MNKSLLSLILFTSLILLTCRQTDGSVKHTPLEQFSDSTSVQSIRSKDIPISRTGNDLEYCINPSLLPKESFTPFNGRILKSDLPKYEFILDTLAFNRKSFEVFFNHIYGFTKTNFFIFNCIIPSHVDGELIEYPFEGDTILIPFRIDLFRELTILTRWFYSENDTIEYIDYYKTPFAAKYSWIEILEVKKQTGRQLIIGKTHFSEGGEGGEEIWIAKVLDNKYLHVYNIYSCGWNYDSDTITALEYLPIKSGIEIYESFFERDITTGLSYEKLLFKQSRRKITFDEF